MKDIYFDIKGNCKLVKASCNSVDFLSAYSKSLHINEFAGVHFETNLN